VCVCPRSVTFDEQQPHQLMLLLNEVLGEIDASQKVRRALGHPHTRRTVFAAARARLEDDRSN
jgi:hypothetical protein